LLEINNISYTGSMPFFHYFPSAPKEYIATEYPYVLNPQYQDKPGTAYVMGGAEQAGPQFALTPEDRARMPEIIGETIEEIDALLELSPEEFTEYLGRIGVLEIDQDKNT